MIIGFSRCLCCNIIGLTVTVIFVVPAVGFVFIHFPVASDIIAGMLSAVTDSTDDVTDNKKNNDAWEASSRIRI